MGLVLKRKSPGMTGILAVECPSCPQQTRKLKQLSQLDKITHRLHYFLIINCLLREVMYYTNAPTPIDHTLSFD